MTHLNCDFQHSIRSKHSACLVHFLETFPRIQPAIFGIFGYSGIFIRVQNKAFRSVKARHTSGLLLLIFVFCFIHFWSGCSMSYSFRHFCIGLISQNQKLPLASNPASPLEFGSRCLLEQWSSNISLVRTFHCTHSPPNVLMCMNFGSKCWP